MILLLVPIYVALFFSALGAAKYGLIDRRAPYTTMPASMILFIAFAISSFAVEPLTGGDPRSMLGMFALGLGGFLFMLAMLILEALEMLPDQPIKQTLGQNNPVSEADTGPQKREQPSRGD